MAFWVFGVISIILVGKNIANAAESAKNERIITGKVVIVTGGAQGIGYAIADNFLKKGAKVVIILDIDEEKGNQAEKTLNSKYGKNKAEYILCDTTKDLDKVSKQIIKKYKYVDILINSAVQVDENKPKIIIKTNAMGTILWSLEFLKCMSKDNGGKGGTIINIASVAAHNIDPLYVTYRATKFAILGFSQSQGHLYNYKKTGVRVITLCPGPTDTRTVYKVYDLYDRPLVERIIKYYNFATIQSPDNVGKGAVKVFENAKSGTSWDIADEKPPVESANTINIVPVEKIDDDENNHATKKKEKKSDDKNSSAKTDENTPKPENDDQGVHVEVKI